MNTGHFFQNQDYYSKYSHIKSKQLIKSGLASECRFSIVIPTFGRAELLKEAIKSCLNQSYSGCFEILVVDNDPQRNNETEKLMMSIDDDRISYYKNDENIGCLPNFNRCIELAESEYLVMLHTDDILNPEFLSTVIPVIESRPDIDLLIPGKKIQRDDRFSHQKGLNFLSKTFFLSHKVVKLREKDFCFYNTAGGPLGIVMKKSTCLSIGGFDETIFPMSDYAFWVRMARRYNVMNLPMELGTYRFFGNISSEDGMLEKYITNEFLLIKELIMNKPYQNLMTGYLYEYINYRVKVGKLNRNMIFTMLTGSKYKFSIINKVLFIWAISKFSISYLFRASVSKITA